jgi:NAD(P)-dependent dehydrogenase (short-subunit alcohol dehydrogenase family)
MKRLEGKTILVTGSSRGFGRSMAYAYAMNGADIAAMALEERELLDLKNSIQKMGGSVFTIASDISKEDHIYEARDLILDEFGRMDAIVNNAAACPWKRFVETKVSDWDYIMDVNLRAPFILTKAFFPVMKEQGFGSIINITSRSAEIGFLAEVAFSPSKWGLEGLTQCLALELQPYNIAVNSLKVASPPNMRLKPTGMTLEELRRIPFEKRSNYADDSTMAKLFGEAWTFLALQDAQGITGQRIGTAELAEHLKKNGWESAVKHWKRKLTMAVYSPYDFPKKASYQTPGGGFEEVEFKF